MKSASDSKRRSDRVGDEPRPIRILLVSPTYNGITGADRDWMNLANSLEPAQFQIVWAGQRSCRKLRPYLNPAVVIDLIDLDFHRFTYLIQTEAYQTRSAWLWTKILADHFFRGLEPVRKLHSRCGAHEFDLVISNSAVVTLGFLYAAFLRCPHIWFVKECLDVSIPECRRLADFIQHNSAAVVVPSQAAARSFSQPVTVIGDGNDLSAVDGRRGRRPLQETCANRVATANLPLVVQIGGGSGWKGQHVMANAFVRLSQQIDEPVFSLLFLGALAPAYRRTLDDILAGASAGWRRHVHFAEYAPDDFHQIQAADIVVHPSALPDPFPNAVREAMILGKPVIASDCGGIPEMIRHEDTGILVPTADSNALAIALMKLLCSPEKRSSIGIAARRYAREHYDIQKCKQHFITFFQCFARNQNALQKKVG